MARRSAPASSPLNMATSDNAEPNDSADILLREEDILAFFLSKPGGEVKNSELVTHFRQALKTGRHRSINRQQFPKFINRLATVKVNADGSKILTLMKKYQRPQDTSNAPEDSNGNVVNRDTAAATVEPTDSNSKNPEPDNPNTTAQVADGEIFASKHDDATESDKEANFKEEQSKNGDERKDGSLSDDIERSEHNEATSTDSRHVEEAHQENEETVTEDNIINVTMRHKTPSSPRKKRKKKEKLSSEVESSDTDSVSDETQSSNDADDNNDPKVLHCADRTPVVIVVEDHTTDEIDGQDLRRVRDLAQRIDEIASKRTSTMSMQSKVHPEPRRPPSNRPVSSTATAYDFTMNDSQREWTLRASYSDYQELAKLLNNHQGNDL